MADDKKGTNDSERQAEVDKLLANPNRQPADDKRLDELLHGENPVKTGDVSVDPVGVDDGNGTGLTDRDTLSGEGGGDDVHREIPSPKEKEQAEEPKQNATESGSARAGSNENKATVDSSKAKREAAQKEEAAQKAADESGKKGYGGKR